MLFLSLVNSFAATPVINFLSPTSGPANGGTTVTLNGTGFTGATAVTIGGAAVSSFSVRSDTKITAITPKGSSGAASVVVTTPVGSNPPNSLFTYTAGGTTFTQILGQPTDHNATINLRSNANLEIYYQYGLTPSVYIGQTGTMVTSPDPFASGFYVTQAVLNGLIPDQRYYYRLLYRPTGTSGTFVAASERSFHTQRLLGASFTFAIQGDSHPERPTKMFNSDLYTQTLSAANAEQIDFYITSGDDFSVDTLPGPYTAAAVTGRYALQLPYFDALSSAALFLGTGNHEQTSLWNYNLPSDANSSNQVPIWAQNARNLYYPVPAPNDSITGNFYSGNSTSLPGINGTLRDYYAWTWGDALFVVIDPYWSSTAQVDNTLGADVSGAGNGKTPNLWLVSHGDQQYAWLKQTLEQSTAKWKFVFAHHVLGTGRGGVERAPLFEWGGENQNGTPGFAVNRPSWPSTIHQLFVQNHVTIFFQGHDHIYAHQQLDGVTYQSLPNPADNTYTAFNSDAYTTGEQFPNSGYTKVSVGPNGVKVDYIREWLPQDEKPPAQVSGLLQFSYSIGTTVGPPPSSCASALNASGQAFSAASGTTSVTVSAPSNCAWAVTGLPDWITSSSPGTGNGTVSLQVAQNTGSGRSATLSIGGLSFAVEQAASSIPNLSLAGSLAQIASRGTWKFTLDAVNLGSSSSTARFSFLGDDGNSLNLLWTFPQQASSSGAILASTLDRGINSNAQFILESTGPDSATPLIGSGFVQSNGSVGGFGTFSNTALGWNAVVPLETRSASSYLLAFDNTANLATGVAIANLSPAASAVPVIVRDDSGNVLGTYSIALPPQGHRSFMLNDQQLGFPVTNGKRGTVEFDTPTNGQISVLGLRTNGSALTTLPVLANVAPGGGSIAHVTYNGGFASTIYIVNTGSSPADFTLAFFDESGSPLAVPMILPQSGQTVSAPSLTRTLAGGAMLVIQTQSQDTLPSVLSSAQVTSSGAVSGFEVFRWTTFGQEASVPLETRAPASFNLIFDNTNGLTTGVALANSFPNPIAATARIYDDTGVLLQTASITLAPREHRSFLLPSAYPVTANKRGMVEFVLPDGSHISVIGLRAKADGTLTTIPILAK